MTRTSDDADGGDEASGRLPRDVQEQMTVARILQQGLVPSVPANVGGLQVETHYRIGGLGQVGGDWFDVFELPGGGVTAVIGDVAGHGISAATTMAALRHTVRAYLMEDPSPAVALTKTSRLTHLLLPGEVATCLIAVFQADHTQMLIAGAGHLPPLLLADTPRYLAVAPGPALGVVDDASYSDSSDVVGDATVLLFTDGLVERRGEPIDDGLQRLASICARLSGRPDLLDRLVAEMADKATEDDLAVVAVRRQPAD